MYQAFKLFLTRVKANLARIARATKNEVEVEDLHSDLWILAQEIGKHRGHAIDFADPADEKLLVGAVNLQNVRRGDWHMRRSVRIDHEPVGDSSLTSLIERLPAIATSDPLVSLLRREVEESAETMLVESYSQAAAYVRVFAHFKQRRDEVCAFLAISDRVLNTRVSAAAWTVRQQRSLFDRIEQIEKTFLPAQGMRYAERMKQTARVTQLDFAFH